MPAPENLQVGSWTLDPASGEIERAGIRRRLEPKTLDLLLLLARSPSRVFSREEIFSAVWPDVIVGDDTLARAVSKLRRALGDDPKAPCIIETIPKRGYRLIEASASPATEVVAAPSRSRSPRAAIALVLAVTLTAGGVFTLTPKRPAAPDAAGQIIARADDFYFQYTREDNEAAIALYERIVETDPDDARALAGLANALVQSAMRWPVDDRDRRGEITTLGQAHASRRLDEPAARRLVDRALGLARDAVRLAPREAASHKALGLAESAAGDFNAALATYETALAIDADAWGVLINVGDVLEIVGKDNEALPYFERAYEAMSKAYVAESARVRPWQARLGVGIARRHAVAGDNAASERWYRRVLAVAPFDRDATMELAAQMKVAGSVKEAERLCRDLAARTGVGC